MSILYVISVVNLVSYVSGGGMSIIGNVEFIVGK